MKVQYHFAVLVIMALGAAGLNGQTDFFYSFSDLSSGVSNSDAVGSFNIGDTGSLYIYYSTNGPADSDLTVGAFLDIATSASDVIRFTAAETFDFEVGIGGTPLGNRWLDQNGGGGSVGATGDVTDYLIDELHAFTVTGGSGIQEIFTSQPWWDQGYDEAADAFQFGHIQFEAIGVGSVNLFTSAGDGLIVNGGKVVPATFGGVTITVVPEPSSVVMLFLSFAVLFARRRPHVNSSFVFAN